jgi:hypothetical protein
MGDREAPGRGGRPGIEDQQLAAAAGKPAQVPGAPGSDGPNADAFDTDADGERLRPQPDEGAADPREGPDDLLTRDSS